MFKNLQIEVHDMIKHIRQIWKKIQMEMVKIEYYLEQRGVSEKIEHQIRHSWRENKLSGR